MPVKYLPDTIQIPAGSTVQTAGMQGGPVTIQEKGRPGKGGPFFAGWHLYMDAVCALSACQHIRNDAPMPAMFSEIGVARSATSPASAPCLHLAEYFFSPCNNVPLVRIAVNLEAVRDNVCAKGFQLFFNGIHCAAEIGV